MHAFGEMTEKSQCTTRRFLGGCILLTDFVDGIAPSVFDLIFCLG
jgi:hypothetical protein